LYASPNIIRVIKSRRKKRTVHVARIGEMRNAHNILVGQSEGKRSPGKPKLVWEDNIRMFLGKRWESVDRIHLAQDRDQWRALVVTVMNLRALLKVEHFLTS
jgi:hypothetical protein